MVPLEGTLCVICGEKLFGHHFEGDSGPLCGLCRQAAPRFRRAVAYGAYEGALRELVHLLKYQGIRPAARRMGRFLNQRVASAGMARPWLVAPVPLAAAKRRVRGFNQAEEIARAFCREQAGSGIQLDTTSLVRTRETVSQTGLTREQRRANLRGAFAVLHREHVQGKTILLVDDVMTTGATAGECARALLRAGAKEVFVATVARATRETESALAYAAGAIAGGTTGHA
jgi:ComF family protein